MNEGVDFGVALAGAAELLRRLPTQSQQTPVAQQLFAHWRERCPQAEPRLLMNREPGRSDVQYDLLLRDPRGGAVALTWLEDSGVPWSVNYADHWAANFVVTVDADHSLTVQQALMHLRMASGSQPEPMESLVNHLLLAREAKAEAPASGAELQEVADSFRRSRGLHSADETHRWLRDIRMPLVHFEEMLDLAVRIGRVKTRVAAERFDAYFREHRSEFDRVRIVQVHADEAPARRLAHLAQSSGLLAAIDHEIRDGQSSNVEALVQTRFAVGLEPALKDAIVNSIVGPYRDADRWVVAQIISRDPARLDARTRLAVEESICREWLTQLRSTAEIEWHWL
jgi:putative peptide maturation system protein